MNTKDLKELDYFIRGYLEALIWTGFDEADMHLEEHDDVGGFTLHSMIYTSIECKNFLDRTYGLIISASTQGEYAAQSGYGSYSHKLFSLAGHDFLLTRNGHGAGFWDRNIGDTGETLTEIAKTFGPVMAYIGDGNRIDIDAA